MIVFYINVTGKQARTLILNPLLQAGGGFIFIV